MPRGSAAVAVIVSLALSGGVGYAVYRVAKDRRLAREAEEAALPKPPPALDEPATARAPRPVDPIEPTDTTEVEPAPVAQPPVPPIDAFIGPAEIDGAYDRGTFDRTITARSASLQKCNTEGASGTIDVTIVIETSGLATATATGFDRSVASCVAGVVRRTRFTGGTERVTVTLPLYFH